LAFLDIDLNTWSMIVFFFNSLFLISMTLAVFGASKALFLVMTLTYILNQITNLAYGIITKQIGFILMVAFQFFLTLVTFVYLNQSTPVYEDIDED
jgi:hypothetical protein